MASEHMSAEMEVNLLSRVAMTWMSPLLRKGYHTPLQIHDVPRCDERLMPNVDAIEESMGRGDSLIRALVRAFWFEWVLSGMYRVARLVVLTALPFVLRAFVAWLGDPNGSTSTGVWLAFAIGLLPMLDMLAMERTIWLVQWIAIRLRTALVLVVCRKLMRKRYASSSVEVGNLISTDVDRVKVKVILDHHFVAYLTCIANIGICGKFAFRVVHTNASTLVSGGAFHNARSASYTGCIWNTLAAYHLRYHYQTTIHSPPWPSVATHRFQSARYN
jgi:hypothetical protein